MGLKYKDSTKSATGQTMPQNEHQTLAETYRQLGRLSAESAERLIAESQRYFSLAAVCDSESEREFKAIQETDTANGMPKNYKNKELAEIFSVCTHTIMVWVKKGKIEAPEIVKGNRSYWTGEQVQRMISGNTSNGLKS